MSTGHWSTQAPQLVQAHSTSSGMTLVMLSTSRSACGLNAASRMSVMSSFGLSGLPVFQAGHRSWQRPQSVQVEASRSIFHEASPSLPTPSVSSSSVFSSVSILPPEVIGKAAGGLTAVGFVWKKMLK